VVEGDVLLEDHDDVLDRRDGAGALRNDLRSAAPAVAVDTAVAMATAAASIEAVFRALMFSLADGRAPAFPVGRLGQWVSPRR